MQSDILAVDEALQVPSLLFSIMVEQGQAQASQDYIKTFTGMLQAGICYD